MRKKLLGLNIWKACSKLEESMSDTIALFPPSCCICLYALRTTRRNLAILNSTAFLVVVRGAYLV